MELITFCSAVDAYTSGIPACRNDPATLYAYVGLTYGSSFTRNAVSGALRDKMMRAFTSGHLAIRELCRQWRDELIQNLIIDNEPADPYYAVLEHLEEAMPRTGSSGEEIKGDWNAAINSACDSVAFHDWTSPPQMRQRVHSRLFEVAKAAKRLRDAGYPISRREGRIFIDGASEDNVVAAIEAIVAKMGGLNVALRVFALIGPLYDNVQERYHVVPHPQPAGGGIAQIPFGYLLLLAVKHFTGAHPRDNSEANWQVLCRLATDYAAMFDVQPYAHSFVFSLDARALIRRLQDLAIYDTLFRLPQGRANDTIKTMRGILGNHNLQQSHGGGWTLSAALDVSEAALALSQEHRGPFFLELHRI